MSFRPSHIINVLIRICAGSPLLSATLVRAAWQGEMGSGCGSGNGNGAVWLGKGDGLVDRGCVSTTCCGPEHVGKWKAFSFRLDLHLTISLIISDNASLVVLYNK